MGATLVSIIGPPAAGKTTLAEYLREALPARLLREDYRSNPFLAESFRGSEGLALPSQLYFLFRRVGQLSSAAWPEEGLVVSDYGFCQDRLYARIKLSEGDLHLYERLRRRIEHLVTPPRVVIHLDASTATLLQRIRQRRRDFESFYTPDYLERLRRAHFHVSLPAECEKILVNGDRTNLLEEGPRADLLREIREALK